jgi:hypothetical protein
VGPVTATSAELIVRQARLASGGDRWKVIDRLEFVARALGQGCFPIKEGERFEIESEVRRAIGVERAQASKERC